MIKNKFISIIIVNYNGKHLLKDCLESLSNLDYPKTQFEIILVDNNSQDSSTYFVKKNYPNVIIINSNKNLGFTGGNNLGLEKAKGDYVVLLNNDTSVDKNWLKELVKSAQDSKTGIVNSKLYFDTPFIELKIESNAIPKSSLDQSINFSPVGVIIENLVCRNKKISNLVWYKSGFNEKKVGDLITRWTKGEAKILIPFGKDKSEKYSIKVHGYPSQNIFKTPLIVKTKNKIIFSGQISSNEVIQINFELNKKEIQSEFINLIQNAGNIIFKDGFSKDKGSVFKIENNERLEFYEEDNSYFNKETNLLAFCGAASLIKRELINEIGFLDGYYFMYYEDIDLSLRAWKSGWNIKYSPKAIVRHKHKASTGKVESEFFLHMIERNHLALIITHFPIMTVLIQVIRFTILTMVTVFKYNTYKFINKFHRTSLWKIRAKARTKTLIFLVNNIIRLIHHRYIWKTKEKRGYKDMEKLLY